MLLPVAIGTFMLTLELPTVFVTKEAGFVATSAGQSTRNSKATITDADEKFTIIYMYYYNYTSFTTIDLISGSNSNEEILKIQDGWRCEIVYFLEIYILIFHSPHHHYDCTDARHALQKLTIRVHHEHTRYIHCRYSNVCAIFHIQQ